MECPSCHTIAEEASARFCTACGTALTDAERSTEHSFVDDRGDAVGEALADDATGTTGESVPEGVVGATNVWGRSR